MALFNTLKYNEFAGAITIYNTYYREEKLHLYCHYIIYAIYVEAIIYLFIYLTLYFLLNN